MIMLTDSPPSSTPTYPRRDQHFAHRYCRLLTKTCAAQDIGPDGCWLLSVIAMLEDTKRYSSPVTFYNAQLMMVAGFTREHTLIAVRKRAIDAGWLYYRGGTKRNPGVYWVTIPDRYADTPDGPCDENTPQYSDESVSESVRESVGKASVNEQGKRRESVSPSTLYPIPNPIKSVTEPNPSRGTPVGDRARGLTGSSRRGSLNNHLGEFKEWYSHYPRKKAPGAAEKAYRAARKHASHETLMEAVKAYAASDEGKREPTYIPYPATWLNQKRWEEDRKEWMDTHHGNGNGHHVDNSRSTYPKPSEPE